MNGVNRNPPSVEDWGEISTSIDDLDVSAAFNNFYGKSKSEIQKQFYNNVLIAYSDLRFMPKIPFQFFLLEFKDFIEAGKFEKYSDSDAANCFIKLIKEKVENEPEFVLPILAELLPTVKDICENQSAFSLDENIYGSFKELYRNIANKLA